MVQILKNMKRILLCLGFLFLCGSLFAHELNGKIISENKTPLEGINVYNKTTGNYTYSDVSGYYEIDDISVGDILVFSGLGFEKQEVTITEDLLDGTLDIAMVDSSVL